MNPLPPVDGMVGLAASHWAQFGLRLRAAGFLDEHAKSLRRTGIGQQADALQRAIVLWHLRRRTDPAACALRMFVLADPVAQTQALALLGPTLLAALRDVGMLQDAPEDGLVSRFDLRVFRGLFVVCDELLQRGDVAYGPGYGTAAFCDMRDAPELALDVGCGAGSVALWLARRARRVVATDINPRALDFVGINAAVNGIGNVETRQGSLFEPVAGECFDVITAQPPYVPHPPAASAATYLYGGRRGDELVRELLERLPPHLAAGGRAMVVFEHPVARDEAPQRLALPGDCCSVLIQGDPIGADNYSLRHAAPQLRRGLADFERAATTMLAHLHDLGIVAVRPQVAIVQKSYRPPFHGGWTSVVPGGADLWSELGSDAVDRLLSAHSVLRESGDGDQRVRIRLPADGLLVRPLAARDDPAAPVHLGLPPGYLVRSLAFSAEEWRAVADPGDCPGPSAELLERAALAGLVERDGGADNAN